MQAMDLNCSLGNKPSIPDVRSPQDYYQFSTKESCIEVFKKEKSWFSAISKGSFTLFYNLGAIPCERLLNRVVDLGKLLCWTSQSLPLSLVFTSSLKKVQSLALESETKAKDSEALRQSIDQLNKQVNLLINENEDLNCDKNVLQNTLTSCGANPEVILKLLSSENIVNLDSFYLKLKLTQATQNIEALNRKIATLEGLLETERSQTAVIKGLFQSLKTENKELEEKNKELNNNYIFFLEKDKRSQSFIEELKKNKDDLNKEIKKLKKNK